MGREYSKKEIKKILSSDLKLPETVEDRIQDTYAMLGVNEKVSMRYTKKHKWMAGLAAAAVMLAGTSIVVVAANKFLTADLVKEDEKVKYEIHVDREKEAHEIKVTTGYLPEGYELKKDGPYGGKIHNDENGGGITIIPMNASELDEEVRLGKNNYLELTSGEYVKEIDLDGQKADVFISDDFHVDSGKSVKMIFIFNEEHGYGVEVWSNSDLPVEEIIKVAEDLKVEVLDSVVPYKTEEELAAMKESTDKYMAESASRYQAGVSAEQIHSIGEEIKNPVFAQENTEWMNECSDLRFTVESAEIVDKLPADQYSTENYSDYEGDIKPWLNEDGTLKQHDRYVEQKSSNGAYGGGTDADFVPEKADSKFVVVKMKVKNYSTEPKYDSEDAFLSPYLTTLTERNDGTYAYPDKAYYSANENYHLQWGGDGGASFPVYFDAPYYTEGVQRLKHFNFRPIEPGEELEYTLAYVVDEDQLEHLYLQFFSGYFGADNEMIPSPYVSISK